jgi:cytochrome c oxidase subunit 3
MADLAHDAPVEHHAEHESTGIDNRKLGMWVFLASEIMFFSGFFGAFIVLRNLNLEVFTHGAHQLDKVAAGVDPVIGQQFGGFAQLASAPRDAGTH